MKGLISAKVTNYIKENKGFILFIALMMVMRSSIADWYHVPTGSMEPTVLPGDRVFVNKMAYQLEIPFTDIGVMNMRSPARGDIVIIQSKAAENRLLKRIVAVEHDRISMQNNKLVINGKPLMYEKVDGKHYETIDDVKHAVAFKPASQKLDNFTPVTVPKGYVLVLGDNRNYSADSRVYGFIPVSELQGKVLGLVTSLDKNNYYLPRDGRHFVPLP
ncbi:signal peptidase I [Aestuariibacter sp. AA17]|uniref:Signal peptidase I n=1 Tax=Fluctibacter corallii TaxID=2984329 RepID=A0ABT3A8R6_9ALTE|nr:signal peptidase I [Aestuariibacter sp. AA17]MCV2885071.1 signal peptidase I [Aestuariibacter sp. AA17]